VLALSEAPAHPHNEARGTFVEIDGVVQNAPAPRFSRSAPGVPGGPRVQGADTRVVLEQVGYDNDALAALAAAGVIPERKE
jgi:alpha-methylacyl-CoA racemase